MSLGGTNTRQLFIAVVLAFEAFSCEMYKDKLGGAILIRKRANFIATTTMLLRW